MSRERSPNKNRYNFFETRFSFHIMILFIEYSSFRYTRHSFHYKKRFFLWPSVCLVFHYFYIEPFSAYVSFDIFHVVHSIFFFPLETSLSNALFYCSCVHYCLYKTVIVWFNESSLNHHCMMLLSFSTSGSLWFTVILDFPLHGFILLWHSTLCFKLEGTPHS